MLNFRRGKRSIIMAALLVGGIGSGVATGAWAQGEPFPGPPPGSGFGGPPDRGRGGPGGFGGPRSATVATIPAGVLATGLNLSAAQKTKIAGIQSRFQTDRENLRLRPTPGQGGGPQRDFEKMRSMEQAANQKIMAVLTAAQKKVLPGSIRQADLVRSVGLPLELVYKLNLSAAQKAKVSGIAKTAQQKRDAVRNSDNSGSGGGEAMRKAREKAHTQTLGVLTPAQRHTVSAYEQTHPRPRFGGGFGGGPTGGFRPGGPPPIQR